MRGTGRNGDAGVDTYVKSSIAPRNNAIAKIIPSGVYGGDGDGNIFKHVEQYTNCVK